MDDKLQEIEQRLERPPTWAPEVIADRGRYSHVAKEQAQLEPLVEVFRDFKEAKKQRDEMRAALEDPELRELARTELPELEKRAAQLDERLKILLLPKAPNDERSVILEVRAEGSLSDLSLSTATTMGSLAAVLLGLFGIGQCVYGVPAAAAGDRALQRSAAGTRALPPRPSTGVWCRPHQRRECDMATYVTLLKYTEQGIKAIKESPSRLEKAKQLLKSLGGELKSFYLVQGRYDAIVIAEVPNDEVVAKFVLASASQGNVRTETTRAFNEEEYRRIISGLP